MFIIPADECLHAAQALAILECYALTPPLFFLFNQPRSPPPPTPAWVMACVAFLSLWEVVLHGLPLSSCFHTCPFNRLGNPSWYLYRPWFSWYRCSLPSPPFTSPPCNLYPSLLLPSPLPPIPPYFVSPFPIMCLSSQVSIYFQFNLPSYFPTPKTRAA